ncbi:uncharacterized protein LOC144663096 [Oculina patagonica]
MADDRTEPTEQPGIELAPGHTAPATRYLSTIKDQIKNKIKQSTKGTVILGIISDNKITLKNLVISMAVIGLEVLLHSEVFDCPVENHKSYGRFWLYAPTAIIFVVNVLIIGDIWTLSDRCFVCDYHRRGDLCAHTIPSIVKAMVGAFVWLTVAFAREDYFVCAEVGKDIHERNITDKDQIREYEKAFAAAKGLSHILAWVVFLILVISGAMMVITKKCFIKDHDLLDDICIFEEREARWAKKVFDEFTRGLRNDEVESADLNEREEKSESKNRSQEVKVTLHPNSIPERFGESMVIKMFKDWKEHDPNWHYLDAYNKFKELYPRVATGDPTKRWSTTYFSKQYSTRNDPGQTESDYGSVRIVMKDLTPNRSDAHQNNGEPKETTNLI